ncbi:MAG: prepilin-type N-terminal cleavage/methylation domain-containing protein [Armatimonadetes bacterium]|jgi:general secretion pathway protein G|nr:prepilin-type N-terminal cleavage/methylation domain-containing protein [Armatimonadota bacterium]
MVTILNKAGQKLRRRGFTLVELLVVIVVLAVLAAIVLPKFMDSSARSKESALKSDLKLARTAISLFHADTGKYPQSVQDLVESDKSKVKDQNGATVSATDWHGPYLDSVIIDPVSGNELVYDNNTGKITSSATGNGLDGTAYNTW